MSPPTSRGSVHLLAHAALQRGLDVAEQQVCPRVVTLGQLRIEVGEDVEVGPQRGAVVHVLRVDARPEERLAPGDALESGQIDAAAGQKIDVRLGEIVADHGDDLNGMK